ncbi:MAG TPA: hypothetical protein VE733_05005 [Streptosporangiaceae bacterium]|jgi:hypothetical protein|nr:hypothetical protein [Streptosporangiaceae bacterium]
MLAVIFVMLFGAGVCALGAIQPDMYFVGVVIFGIGALGFLVWAGDQAAGLLRLLRRLRQ